MRLSEHVVQLSLHYKLLYFVKDEQLHAFE